MTYKLVKVVIFLLASTSKLKCDSERDNVLSNPFLQQTGKSKDENMLARDRILTNPFLQVSSASSSASASSSGTGSRSQASASVFTQGEKTVTFNGDTPDNEFRNAQVRLDANPFLQNPGQSTVVFHNSRPSINRATIPKQNPDTANPAEPEKPIVVFHNSRPSITRRPTPTYTQKSLLNEYDAICGLTSRLEQGFVQLIANGDTVTRHYPWLVAIYHLTESDPEFLCGGTLISEKHMISAAHCFPYRDVKQYQFVIANDLQIKDKVVRQAKEIVRHPGYLPKASDADIAIIIFNTDVPLITRIRPICLWLEGRNNIAEVTGEKGLIVGWGNDENNQKSEALPKQAELPIYGSIECIRNNTKFAGVVGHNSFCAGYTKDTGACPGDSGSGFIIERENRWYLRGIVSSTLLVDRNICQITDFTAMTDVARYSEWIISKIRR